MGDVYKFVFIGSRLHIKEARETIEKNELEYALGKAVAGNGEQHKVH